MKSKKKYPYLFLLLVIVSFSFTITGHEDVFKGYPVPTDKNMIFYIQKNYNTNTVVYTANLNKDGKLDPKKPVNAFWRRYQEDGRIKALSFFENTFGFGINSKPIKNKKNAYLFSLTGLKKIKFVITQNKQGVVEVATMINNIPSKIKRVYIVVAAHKNLVFPKIASIEVFGNSLKTNKLTYQKIIND